MTNEKEQRPLIRRRGILKIFFSLVVLALIGSAVYLSTSLYSFDVKKVKPTENFVMKNSLTCTMLYSTHRRGAGLALPFLEEKNFPTR